MNSGHLFLVTFSACLFALAVVAIAVWQIGLRMLRKLFGDHAAGAASLARIGADRERTVAMCEGCCRQQPLPFLVVDRESRDRADAYMGSIGWRRPAPGASMLCPVCLTSTAPPPAVS